MSEDESSLLTSAGIGGAVVCCAALELLGGTALLAGVAAAVGVSTSIAYLSAVGLGGLLTVAGLLLYRTRSLTHA